MKDQKYIEKFYAKQLQKNYKKCLDTTRADCSILNFLICYLEYRRDTYIIKEKLSSEELANLQTIEEALAEYDAYKNCGSQFYGIDHSGQTKTPQVFLIQTSDHNEVSAAERLASFKKVENMHWENFCKIIENNIRFW